MMNFVCFVVSRPITNNVLFSLPLMLIWFLFARTHTHTILTNISLASQICVLLTCVNNKYNSELNIATNFSSYPRPILLHEISKMFTFVFSIESFKFNLHSIHDNTYLQEEHGYLEGALIISIIRVMLWAGLIVYSELCPYFIMGYVHTKFECIPFQYFR